MINKDKIEILEILTKQIDINVATMSCLLSMAEALRDNPKYHGFLGNVEILLNANKEHYQLFCKFAGDAK